MKVLVIGSGGREHTLVWKLHQSSRVKKIFCAPGNAGTKKNATNVDIKANDINGLVKFAVKEKVDYIALSFVRTAQDIVNIKNKIKKLKSYIPIILYLSVTAPCEAEVTLR